MDLLLEVCGLVLASESLGEREAEVCGAAP